MAIRIGFLGFAHGHQYGVVNQARAAGAEVFAIADEEEERLREAAARIGPGEHRLYRDYEKALAEDEIDLVSICTENNKKKGLIVDAIRKGKPVIVEKPLCLSMDELKEISNAAEETDAIISMFLTLRFSPPYVAVKECLDRGEIGKPVFFYAARPHKLSPAKRPSWFFNPKTYGNVILDLAIHDVDIILWSVNSKVSEVKAYMGKRRFTDRNITDHCALLLKFKDETQAAIHASWLTPDAAPYHGRTRLDVHGTGGEVFLDEISGKVEICTLTEPPHPLSLGKAGNLVQNVIESLKAKRAPLVDTKASIRATKICLLGTLSAETGKTLALTEEETPVTP